MRADVGTAHVVADLVDVGTAQCETGGVLGTDRIPRVAQALDVAGHDPGADVEAGSGVEEIALVNALGIRRDGAGQAEPGDAAKRLQREDLRAGSWRIRWARAGRNCSSGSFRPAPCIADVRRRVAGCDPATCPDSGVTCRPSRGIVHGPCTMLPGSARVWSRRCVKGRHRTEVWQADPPDGLVFCPPRCVTEPERCRRRCRSSGRPRRGRRCQVAVHRLTEVASFLASSGPPHLQAQNASTSYWLREWNQLCAIRPSRSLISCTRLFCSGARPSRSAR
jgi:hypothetical protein